MLEGLGEFDSEREWVSLDRSAELAARLQSTRKAAGALRRCIDHRNALIIVTCCQGKSGLFSRLPPEMKDEVFKHLPDAPSLTRVMGLPLRSFLHNELTLDEAYRRLTHLEELCGLGSDVRKQAIAEITGYLDGDEQETAT